MKVSSTLNHPPQNDGPLNFFAKLKGNHILMVNFSKFRFCQTFGLIELHNLSKGQLADRIFKLWKSDSRLRTFTSTIWNSDFLIFPTFKQILSGYL